MLRDENAADWTRGLDVILQVGETSDIMPAPEDFPKCGSILRGTCVLPYIDCLLILLLY